MEKRNPMIWWLAGLLVCGLIYLLSPILTPFLVAAILAYIANPLVNKIDAFQFKNLSPSRTVASLLVMCLILAVILLILLIVVPLIQKEVVLLLQK
ncbi:MAG TPA: AI-2E family transporter, partial [Methylotenera sp.]|nr:AI-2E family transporter [Methylotenera sp.]